MFLHHRSISDYWLSAMNITMRIKKDIFKNIPVPATFKRHTFQQTDRQLRGSYLAAGQTYGTLSLIGIFIHHHGLHQLYQPFHRPRL
jgi:hypothetical protein